MRKPLRFFAAFVISVVLFVPGALAGPGGIRKPPVSPEAVVAKDVAAGKITKGEAALYRAQLLFTPSRAPERYRARAAGMPKICATGRIRKVLESWNDLSDEGRSIVPAYLHPGIRRDRSFVRKGTRPAGSVQPAAGAAQPAAGAAKIELGDDPNAPPYQYTYTTTNFLIHYNTSGTHRLMQTQDSNHNGIPDIVELAGTVLEDSWIWYTNEGYRLPPETDTYYYNIYFENPQGAGWLGYTYPIDWPDSHSRSFIALDADFSGQHLPDGTPIAAFDQMRTTASHEFFHACQFAYDANEDNWWMEATAVWVQDQVGAEWDAVNDYVGWVMYFLYYPEVSLDSEDDFYRWYEDVLWPIFLQSHIDPDAEYPSASQPGSCPLIRRIWEACEGPPSAIEAMQTVLAASHPGGFDAAWQEFLVANYTADYPEAAQFPDEYGNLWYNGDIYTYPTGSRTPSNFLPEGLGANYIRFHSIGSPGYDLTALFSATTWSPNWTGILVGKRTSGGYTRLDTASGVEVALAGFINDYSQAVLIVSPVVAASPSAYAFSYSGQLTVGDNQPPAPDPMTFFAPPHAGGASQIAMTATTASDDRTPPVQYRFEETTGNTGGSSSSWQSGTDFTDGSLETNTRYGYRVRARDSADPHNYTQYSLTAYAYTLCSTPDAPVLHDPAPTKLYITISAADGNPAWTEYAVYNQTAGNYISATGQASGSAFWAARSTWEGIRITGLAPSTSYSFVVKARNGDAVETGFSPAGSMSTLAADTTPPVVSNVAVVPTWVKEHLTSTVDITATGSDLVTGGSDIVAAEYWVDTADPGQGNATAMSPADGAFDSPTEAVMATLSVAGWSIAQSPYDLYVRVQDESGRWSTPVHFEIEVVDGIPPDAVNDLAGVPAPAGIEEAVGLSVSSASSETSGKEAARAVDSSTATTWASAPQAEASGETILFDLASPAVISKVTLYTSDRVDLFPASFKVKVSDGTDWWSVVAEKDYQASAGANTWCFGARLAAQIEIEIAETPLDTSSGLYSAEIAEVQSYADISGTRRINLSWSAPHDTGPTAAAASYLVKWSTDEAALAGSFVGTIPPDAPPVPGAAGSPQSMQVTGLDPGVTYWFGVKSVDDYDNWSDISNVVSVATLGDPRPYVALDSPQDESELDIPTPPTFTWHANMYDTFKVQFSNVPTFPARPYKDALGRRAKTYKFGVRRTRTYFTPSKGQWKTIKKLAAGMDGTLYWRIEARASKNRLLGVAYSEVYSEYGFNTGTFVDTQFGPCHDKEGTPAVWPDNRPQFVWDVTNPVYSKFYIDFAATADININDRRNTYSVLSRNRSRTWFRPTAGQWKQIKKRFAGVNAGLIYWRVRGFDADKAFSAVSAAAPLLVDSPTFQLRKPGPRHDGTVHPEEPFVLEWGINGEGYNQFQAQVSLSDAFPKGRSTMNLRRVKDKYACNVTKGQVKRLKKLADAAGTDTFYWRLIATDVDHAISVESEAQSVILSVEPVNPE